MKTGAQIGDLIHLKLTNRSGVAIAVTAKQVTVKLADGTTSHVINSTKYITVIN